jgi:hypothetical protein
MDKLTDFLILIGLFAIATTIHLIGHGIAARVAGLKIEKVSLFYVILFKFQTPAFPLEIGILPFGGSVKLSEEFQKKSLPVDWLITISGPLLLAITAVLALPFDRFLPAIISGFEQIIHGAISPSAYAEPLIQQFFTECLATSVLAAYGILASKLVAFNLFPLANLNGGQILTSLFPNFHDSKWGMGMITVGFLLVLAISISWGVALVIYLFK